MFEAGLNALERLKKELRIRAHFDYKNSYIDKNIKILAVGDSWFDYPFVNDIVDHLREMKYAVFKKSKIGNTLEDIVFGVKYSYSYKNKGQLQLNSTIKSLKKHEPRFVIFSGGGNDIVGEQMMHFINHKDTGLPLIREEMLDYMVNVSIKNAIVHLYKSLIEINPKIDFLIHGYDYGFPSGKSFHGIVGPWILPTMGMKNITEKDEQKYIIKTIVDKYNVMLKGLESELSNFHHIDIRGMFPNKEEWHNEIHLTEKGYLKVARRFHDKLVKILKYNPIEMFE